MMIERNRIYPTGLLFALLLCLWSGALFADSGFRGELKSRLKAGGDSGLIQVGDQPVHGHVLITEMYQSNDFSPAWNEDSIALLQREIQGLEDDGLNPADYWFSSIEALLKEKQQGDLATAQAVDLDILLTEAFVRAYYNLLVGKVDPERLDDNFNIAKPLDGNTVRPRVIAQLTGGKIAEAFKQARPANKLHYRLREALVKYRAYRDAGGWPGVDEGKTLKPGDRDARVGQLRARLAVTEDYTGNAADPELFDPTLEDAVKHFQQRHGMEKDGVVGAGTLAAMNVPVEQRIDQLRVNLERQRWYMHEAHGDYIVADIAGFHVNWVRDDAVFWDAKAQVGREYTQTPVFKDKIRIIEFNPTWTIPPGIMRRSILPGLKKDPEYLAKKGYLLLTHEGREVDPGTVDWASVKTMPYMVRQPPGPDNALGLVKFLFPNKHLVYLHDTNHREHFADASRSFSSGCVRVDKPFDLAERLLAGQGDWDRSKIDKVVASGKTTRVNLEKPVRIIIAYGTAAVRDGRVLFKEDIYNRDAKVLQALNAPFKLRARDKTE